MLVGKREARAVKIKINKIKLSKKRAVKIKINYIIEEY